LFISYTTAPDPNVSGIRRARILDVFGEMESVRSSHNCTIAALHLLRNMGFDAVDFRGMNAYWQQVLWQIGARRTTLESNYMCCVPPIELGLDWHVVPADGDGGFWDLCDFASCDSAAEVSRSRLV
jgi:hypothetical protein